MTTLADCEKLDTADPLASCRDRFTLPPGVVYLDGNSLGALPAAVPARMRRVVEEEWGTELIRAWNTRRWVDLPRTVGDKIAPLIGAEPGSVVACDSTSINLFKLAAAAVKLREDRLLILTDRGNFPTDLYVLSGLGEVRLVEPEQIPEAITSEVGVVALTEVDYRTGRRHDLPAVTAAAHQAGALVVWDLAHSAGAFPVDLSGAGADFAVGCGYKYLNGGPGAPAFVYIAPRHQREFRNPITGWFGHASPFDFSLQFVPAEGVARARVGTPHILSLAALDEALDVFAGVDLEEVRRKSVALSELFLDLVTERLDGHGFRLASPRDPQRRGSQVSLRHPEGYRIMQALIDRGVIGDFRAPNIVRFGFAPLYLRFVDVWRAVETLSDVMQTGSWRDPRYAVRAAVT